MALGGRTSGKNFSHDDIDLITRVARSSAAVIENAWLFRKTSEQANCDGLTGLFNYRYFYERLDEEISRCTRFNDVFTLIMLDLDNFSCITISTDTWPAMLFIKASEMR